MIPKFQGWTRNQSKWLKTNIFGCIFKTRQNQTFFCQFYCLRSFQTSNLWCSVWKKITLTPLKISPSKWPLSILFAPTLIPPFKCQPPGIMGKGLFFRHLWGTYWVNVSKKLLKSHTKSSFWQNFILCVFKKKQRCNFLDLKIMISNIFVEKWGFVSWEKSEETCHTNSTLDNLVIRDQRSHSSAWPQPCQNATPELVITHPNLGITHLNCQNSDLLRTAY